MRIAHVRDAAWVARSLVEILRQLGHEADLYTPPESAAPSRLAKLFSVVGRVPQILDMNRRIRAGGYDLVHLHVANGGWIPALGGYPYVVHCHGSEIRPGLYEFGRRQLALYTLHRAEHVFYVTPDLYRHLEPFRPDATLLPNPVDTIAFAPVEHPAVPEPLHVLIAVPLTAFKDPEPAFQALAALRAAGLGSRLKVSALGFGKHAAAYAHLLGWEDVEYLPERGHDAMAALYHQHDVILGQMQIGSLGMVELEAMACGKPVICHCDLAAYASSYGEAPPVLAAATAEEICRHLEGLIEEPATCLSIGGRSRAWVLRYHSYSAIGNRLIGQYEQVLMRRPRHR